MKLIKRLIPSLFFYYIKTHNIMSNKKQTTAGLEPQASPCKQDVCRVAACNGGRVTNPNEREYPSVVFFPKDNTCYESIGVGDIVCIEARRYKCVLYMADNTMRCLSCPMQDVEAVLDPKVFIRVHRSFIVNITHIRYFYYGHLVMSNNIDVPIGKNYQKTLREALVFCGGRKRKKD